MTTTRIITLWPIFVSCSSVIPAFAQSNGMDMSMDGPMDLASGNMLPWLHFTPGDVVWFFGWVPRSAGTMIGTCIGMFLLSVLERWLAACLDLAESHWAERNMILIVKSGGCDDLSSLPSPLGSSRQRFKWSLPPFVPEFDITRGVLFAAQWIIKVLLMLAVMTFQLGFIISIVIGSGVGETLFGRFLSSSYEH